MLDWAGDVIQVAIAVIAVVALAVSIHAERRVSRLGSMSFPGVIATWKAFHKAGPREDMPPLERDMHEVVLRLSESVGEFLIAEVALTRGDDYWKRYGLASQSRDGGSVAAYITRYEVNANRVPQFLRVKVERRGGVQASCWQWVRIEGAPS